MAIRIIGLMSGSSMDGLDFVCCDFDFKDSKPNHHIIASETIPYSHDLIERLEHSADLDSRSLLAFHTEFGLRIGEKVREAIKRHKIDEIDLIGFHGHTVFHEPESHFSFQLGSAHGLSTTTGLPVVSDFRNTDMSLKGHGAPLVPVAEADLFPGFRAFLNLGGIANLGLHKESHITGFDVCPFNMAMNEVASLRGMDFDENGTLASHGEVIEGLLKDLSAISFYNLEGPRSIDRQWYMMQFQPVVRNYERVHKAESVLRTLIEHFSSLISQVLNKELQPEDKTMISGGGAKNSFFISMLREKTKSQIILPENEVIDYKEAIIFAYLAMLRVMNRNNVLSSVTGAERNSVGGALYGNFETLINKLHVGSSQEIRK
jgi:anhydro-N-acetylmuramic acid kinase